MFEWIDETDRTISRVERARDLGRHAIDHATTAKMGISGLRRMGLAARRQQTVVGGQVFHSVSDREQALAQLMNDFAAFTTDAYAQLSVSPDVELWFRSEAAPVLDQWMTFRANERAAWVTRWATDWTTFERWWDKLVELRRAARAHGIELSSPDPRPLPRTIWERGALGVGSKLDAFLNLIRTIAYSLAALVGLWSLFKVYRELRAPAEVPA